MTCLFKLAFIGTINTCNAIKSGAIDRVDTDEDKMMKLIKCAHLCKNINIHIIVTYKYKLNPFFNTVRLHKIT